MDADQPIDLRGIANLLKVSQNTPNQWRQRGVLPPPDQEFKDLARPLWRKSTIIRWAQSTGRWPPGSVGRPEEWSNGKKRKQARKPTRIHKNAQSGFRTAEQIRSEIPLVVFQPPPSNTAA